MTLIAMRAHDVTLTVIPRGMDYDKCGRCGSVVLLDNVGHWRKAIGGSLHRKGIPLLHVPESSDVRCLGCAAIEGNADARLYHQGLFHCEPEERDRQLAAAGAHQ